MYLEALRESLVRSCGEDVQSCEEIGVSKSTASRKGKQTPQLEKKRERKKRERES